MCEWFFPTEFTSVTRTIIIDYSGALQENKIKTIVHKSALKIMNIPLNKDTKCFILCFILVWHEMVLASFAHNEFRSHRFAQNEKKLKFSRKGVCPERKLCNVEANKLLKKESRVFKDYISMT